MKLIAIGDTHGKHNELTLPGGDILLHIGDFSDDRDEFDLFYPWFTKQPHLHKILLFGNHEENKELGVKKLPGGITLLESDVGQTSVTIEGIKFCLPGAVSTADVVVSHCPPKNILDKGTVLAYGTRVIQRRISHCGYQEILDQVQEIQPDIHIFGHAHRSFGMKEVDGIKYINVSQMGSGDTMPVVIEL